MDIKIFSSKESFGTTHSNDLIFEYRGIDKVPYLRDSMRGTSWDGENFYFVVLDGTVIVGALVFFYDNREEVVGLKNWVSSIGVNPSYQGKGLVRGLVGTFFELCKNHDIRTIKQSSYTEDGLEKVFHVFDEYTKKYPEVDFRDVRNIF